MKMSWPAQGFSAADTGHHAAEARQKHRATPADARQNRGHSAAESLARIKSILLGRARRQEGDTTMLLC